MVGRWAPVAVWMAVVFFFSSISDLGRARRVPDWISHPVEYAVGAALLCRALRRPGAPLDGRTVLVATLAATLYGMTDEYHQSFVPGRTSDAADVAKDLAGAALGSFIYRRWTAQQALALSAEPPS